MPYDPELELDHLKFWKVEQQKLSRDVTYKGQFDEKAVAQKVSNLVWIGNPTEKTFNRKKHTIRYPEIHYLAYFLPPPEKQVAQQPRRFVLFRNQLQEKPVRWLIGHPTFLLVPASKVEQKPRLPPPSPPPPPPAANHFVCYPVLNRRPFAVQLVLQDQIDRMRVPPKTENIQMLIPAFFCVPVSKNREDLLHPRAHLALYDFVPDPIKPPARVIARDQFKTWPLVIEESIMFGVPTEKIKFGSDRKQPIHGHP